MQLYEYQKHISKSLDLTDTKAEHMMVCMLKRNLVGLMAAAGKVADLVMVDTKDNDYLPILVFCLGSVLAACATTSTCLNMPLHFAYNVRDKDRDMNGLTNDKIAHDIIITSCSIYQGLMRLVLAAEADTAHNQRIVRSTRRIGNIIYMVGVLAKRAGMDLNDLMKEHIKLRTSQAGVVAYTMEA